MENLFGESFKLNQVYESTEPVVDVPTNPIENNTIPIADTPPVIEEEEKVVVPVVAENNTTEEVQEQEASFIPFINHLSEKGIFAKSDKTYEDSELGFEQAVEDTLNERWEKKLAELDETTRNLLGLHQEGLDINNYIDLVDYSEVNLEDLNNQKILTFNYLIDNGYDKEAAEAQVNKLEESDLLSDQAKIALNYLAKAQEREVAYRQEQERLAIQAKKDKAALEHEKIKNEIIGLKNLGQFNLPEGTGQGLYDYIYKPIKNGKTQSEIDGEKQENRLLLAYLMWKKFDVNTLQTIADTKTSSDLRKKLTVFKDQNAKPVSNGEPEKMKYTNNVPNFKF